MNSTLLRGSGQDLTFTVPESGENELIFERRLLCEFSIGLSNNRFHLPARQQGTLPYPLHLARFNPSVRSFNETELIYFGK